MNLLSMLGGNAFVMFNKELAHEVSVNGAIIFGQLCSSYESFGSKEMLTSHKGKEYFFLTAEVIEEETALTYKQQLKAIKDLEEAGYIETVIMGQPAKKYFHITNKIFEQFQVSSDKKEELNEDIEPENLDLEPSEENFSYDKREELGMTKDNSKPLPFGSAYKEINKKNKKKNIKIIDDDMRARSAENYQSQIINQELIDSIWDSVKDEISKRTFNAVLRKVKDKQAQGKVDNFRDYFITALTNKEHDLELRRAKDKALVEIKKSKNKRSERKALEYLQPTREESQTKVPFYNWLES